MKNKKNSTTRREFLKNTALIGLGGISFPPPFYINKGVSKDSSLIGHGEFKYKVDKEWGINTQFPVNDCHEMVLDKDKNLFMTTTHKKNNILKYNQDGKIIDSWTIGEEGTHGLTIVDEGGEEFLFITDYEAHKVYKTTKKGKILLEIDWPKNLEEYKKAEDFKPTETAIAPNGDIYICDGYGLDFIIQYDQYGNYIRHFGGHGELENQFKCCHGITIDNRKKNPTLLITSRTTNEFKRFTLEGVFIEKFQLPGCWICRPVLDEKNLYFSVIVTKSWDNYDGMLAVLDESHKVISLPGGSSPQYLNDRLLPPVSDNKTFFNPHDICIDGDKNLYIPQWNSKKTYPIKLLRV